jgi:hypothetical protein
MKHVVEAFSADLRAAGVAPREAREVARAYALALRRQNTSAWIAFYGAVFAALKHGAGRFAVFPGAASRQGARASLLSLLEDDLGATLFSRSQIAKLRLELQAHDREHPSAAGDRRFAADLGHSHSLVEADGMWVPA